MNVPSKSLAITVFCFVLIFAAALTYLQILWADWAIRTIFNRDFHGLQIFAGMLIIELLCPKSLSGLTTILLLLMTLYIILV